jgi:carbon-monoxide dehydrogenase medium subunit
VKLPPFRYHRAHGLDEALHLLAGDEGTVALAGGQTLLPSMTLGMSRPGTLVDLGPIPGLGGVAVDGDVVSVGAMARHRMLERHPEVLNRCPMVAEAGALIGSVAIRHRGTVGGALAVADPAAEWPCVAVALDGEVDVARVDRVRTVPATELFAGPFRSSLAHGELITGLRLQLPPPRSGSAFVELSLRHAVRAVVGAAAVLETDLGGRVVRARVAVANAGPTPMRAVAAEAALAGERPTDEAIAEAAAAVRAAVDPPGDATFSTDYRRHVAGTLAERALLAARDRLPREAA